jgi:hypothetical protein
MSYNTPLEYIVSKLNERREQLKETLGSGVVKDYAEYQRLCGVISGLDYATQTTLDLAKRLEKDDE